MSPTKPSAPPAKASPQAVQPPLATSPLQDTMDFLTSLFPVTFPIPNPTTDDTLIPASDIMLEQELLRNPDNFRSWASYIDHIIESNVVKRPPPDLSLTIYQAALLGPFASSSQRTALRRITSIYERALAQFPTRSSLWRDYLQIRSRFVLGEPKGGYEAKRKRDLQDTCEKLDFGPTLIDSPDDEDFGLTYRGGLDGIVGWKEWKSLAALHERALMWLPTMPCLWLSYLSMLTHPQCPPTLSYTHARRTFDRALRTLPVSLHLRIWKVYLRWAERRGGETCLRVWRRYLRVDASLTERYVSILLAQKEDQAEEDEEDEDIHETQQKSGPVSKALEASKLLLGLARGAMNGSYISPEGKSPYQLFIEWLELTEKYPDEIGLDPEEEKQALQHKNSASTASSTLVKGSKAIQHHSRGTGKSKAAAAEEASKAPSSKKDAETDPRNPCRLNVTAIIHSDGLDRFEDQSGRLWTGLATYWIKRGEFQVARDTLEAGMKSVKTVRDFTQIFDAYAETSENVIAFMMDELAEDGSDEDQDDEEQSREEKEAELDRRMQEFEELMERRPFLVNDVLLRRNPDDVQEWEKRVVLYGDNDDKIVETYREAIQKINPRKATANFHQLFLNFAQLYEYGGSAGVAKLSADGGQGEDVEEIEGDLDSARKIFEKAITIPFRRVDDLAEIWCEWAEMELRHSNYDQAIRIMARSVGSPRNTKGVSYHDDTLPPQSRLFKSLKLWSFYVDLEESVGEDVESTKRVYEKMLELKIANAQIMINYATFLEDNKYFEESFKVYERGVELFSYPVAFEIWNVYLSKFVKRYGGGKLERARDLFEQALDKCPARFCKPLMLMYGKLEEEHGLAKRAMKIYERATRSVSTDDRFDMFVFYIAKAASNFGLAATRPIYESAIESLPDKQTADMCLRFAEVERKLGEIDRARAIYAHASQFCDPRTHAEFWKQWNQFEIETGSEDTFREMLRIKRSVQAQYNTDVSYIAASGVSSAQRAQEQALEQALVNGGANKDGNDGITKVEASSRKDQRQPAFVAATTAASGARTEDEVNGDTGDSKNEEVVGGDDEEDDDLL
ncbi:related to SYF1 - member of the NineTeen Complex involved in splicing [Melanopsichium pennsylvanicum]|uniref:Pre-mRNA-splicing factor SYF1 n=1 Tax=Melanopsichium pennsylvanicum TaxID=63383 RepID=A0AAJ4XLR7_9BASI|nr:related to SYF1 - member of the NineTeen Complex involved in splicing [Melanopsichium pennsylvanicum]